MQLGIVPLYRINMFRCTDGKTKETPPAPSSVEDVVRLFNEGALRKAFYKSISTISKTYGTASYSGDRWI